ncbi:MAG TPA: glycosyltransferase family 4 protein [Longimicrobiales bacterium]|nr:glycosyltransferase family 4 protein [Longimicrobiales bacterium]
MSGSGASRPYRLLLTTWQSKAAGSIQSVEYLARGLAELGHDVRVACPPDGVLGRRLAAGPVPVVPLSFERGWSLAAARALARVIREQRVELVDAQESRDRKAAILARWVHRTPNRLVITRRQMSATLPLLNALYARAADRIIAISEGVARDLASRGTPRRAISVVHTGLDPARIPPSVPTAAVDALREEHGLDPSLPTVGVVARRKDQETLLRAAARLPPLNVLFVGIERDGELAALEPALPEGSRVVYAGFRGDVAAHYALLDAMVLATRREGLSQAILEAMAAGVPVVSAAVGGTPEVVRHEANGLLFPPGDDGALAAALRRILEDDELRARCVAEGRAAVAGPFHMDAFVRGTERVYRELLEG